MSFKPYVKLVQIRHACRDVTMCAPTVEPIPQESEEGILLQESIADFLYFSRKAYFLRLNICHLKPH